MDRFAFITILLYLANHFTHLASINPRSNLTKNDCTYKDERFGTIDLTSVGLKHGVPAFRHIPKDDYFYSYNPCYPFSEQVPCTNIALCQIDKTGSLYYSLGFNSIVSWSVTVDGKITLVYSNIDRQTIVNLVCWDQLDQFVVNGEYQLKKYNFTLLSKCACWNGC